MLFKLKIIDRLLLNSVLPVENDILTLKIVRKIREDCSFDEAETKQIGFAKTEDGSGTIWKDNSVEKEIEIGEKGVDIIFNALKEMNKNKKLTENHFHLYELFVGDRV